MPITQLPSFYISKLWPFYPKYTVLEWSVLPRTITLINPLFKIYRSGSPTDGFEKIGETNLWFWEDDTVTMLDLDRDIYYYVEVEHNGQTIRTNTRDINGEILDKRLICMHRKVSRDWYLVMRKFNGVPILFYKRKHWGTRCPDCYDELTRETLIEHCTTCYGTSWVGGYYKPLKMFAKAEPPQDSNLDTDQSGPTQITNTVFTILGYPTVEKDDLIFEMKERKLYLIIEKTETQMKRDAVHQSVPTSDLPRDNVKYLLDTTDYNEFNFTSYFGYPPRGSK